MRATFIGLLVALACVAIDVSRPEYDRVLRQRGRRQGRAGPPTLAAEDLKVAENGVEGKIVKIEPIDWPVKVQV